MKRFVLLRAVILAAMLLVVGLLATPIAEAALSVDTSPGSGPPPATLGGYTMVPAPQDQGTNNTTVDSAPATTTRSFSFDPQMTLLTIGHGWCASNWAGGLYNGRIYDTPGNTVTLTLPTPMSAVYFYAQPDDHLPLNITATAQDGTSVSSGPTPSQSYSCMPPGAYPPSGQFFGFYGTNGDEIQSITISLNDPNALDTDFAIGNFAVDVDQYISDLYTAVQGVGPGSSLSSKVQALQAAVSAQQTSTACGILADFVKLVNVQTGKKIDPSTADELMTDYVQPIGTALGCT